MPNRYSEWRIRLVSIIAALIVCVLVYRIIQVQIIRHDTYSEMARKQQKRKINWPARRGSIFDRNGYPVAVSHNSYDIGITPRDFSQADEALKELSEVSGRSLKQLSRLLRKDAPYVPVVKGVNLSVEQHLRVSSLPGVKLDACPERLNPLGAMTPGFIGSVDHGGNGNGGLELSLQQYLQGSDGWIVINRSARDKSYRSVNAPGKKPVNGHNIFLTIDSGIQSIVDFELEQAVDRYGAVGGAAIVIDPWTGDIIAFSEKASSRGRGSTDWRSSGTLYSTSCIFEPGSTFKLVTDAFLLEKGKVDPYDVFYGENGTAKFDFGTFRDDHPYEWLTFKESFVFSSNICTIKAMGDTDKRDFYSFILNMGFGGRTGISTPAESKGRLRETDEWSGRSLASISIGQEIGVTGLQLVMAYCAVANGGTLVAPRVALEARDQDGRTVEKFPVIKVRRVFSPETAETMVDFCRGVVREGTGTRSAISGIEIAGKTGTAQKSDGYRYIEGRYVASFAGFAPAGDPRLVCLVILDEPAYAYHYGGTSAGVAFRKIIEGINMSTDIFLDRSRSMVAIGSDDEERVEIPNLLRMTAGEAETAARKLGFRLDYSTSEGEIFSQVPGPGTLVEPDAGIAVAFRTSGVDTNKKVSVPDLRGLSIRKARRMLIECGLKSSIRGYGSVRKQTPGAGAVVRAGDNVVLHCSFGSTARSHVSVQSFRRGSRSADISRRRN
ncbi:MAG: PASTA domain-containing protein [Candidatus Krumholzibacteria bacterium]|nr:PASTA domain-containing protein [Candidatus Krumholzibacteria bacterium]